VTQTAEEIVDGIAEGTIQLLTISDIVRLTSTSRSTVERWCRGTVQGVPKFPEPVLIFGRSPRWTQEQFKEWLQLCTEKGKS